MVTEKKKLNRPILQFITGCVNEVYFIFIGTEYEKWARALAHQNC